MVSDKDREGEEEERGSGSGFKVVDRRRFDSEGRTRDEDREVAAEVRTERPASNAERVSAERPVSEGQPVSEEPAMGGEPRGEPYTQGPELSFTAFVVSLATQAMWQLGEGSPPPGVNIPKDKAAAKQTIDIIQMLERKTRGNLDQEEAQTLEDILHTLRIMFLRA